MKRLFAEALPLASVLAIAALLLAFGLIANLVSDGAASSFDRRLLLLFRDTGGAAAVPPWVVEVARDLTALGSFAVLTIVTVAVLGYLLLSHKRAAALLVFAAVVGGVVINNLLKLGFARPRPDLVAPLTHVTSASFPSGHAALSAITWLTLAALLARTEGSRRLRFFTIAIGIFLTVAVGASRVFLGVHYPTDVLAGWCVGAAWALICWTLMARLQGQGRVEPPGEPAEPVD